MVDLLREQLDLGLELRDHVLLRLVRLGHLTVDCRCMLDRLRELLAHGEMVILISRAAALELLDECLALHPEPFRLRPRLRELLRSFLRLGAPLARLLLCPCERLAARLQLILKSRLLDEPLRALCFGPLCHLALHRERGVRLGLVLELLRLQPAPLAGLEFRQHLEGCGTLGKGRDQASSVPLGGPITQRVAQRVAAHHRRRCRAGAACTLRELGRRRLRLIDRGRDRGRDRGLGCSRSGALERSCSSLAGGLAGRRWKPRRGLRARRGRIGLLGRLYRRGGRRGHRRVRPGDGLGAGCLGQSLRSGALNSTLDQ